MKNIALAGLLVLASCATGGHRSPDAPKPGWRWAENDGWTTTAAMPDKLEHFTGGYVGTLSLLVLNRAGGQDRFQAYALVCMVAGAALAWEVKDAFYNCQNFPEKCGKSHWPHGLIGDGFSWRDMVSSWVGAGVAWGVFQAANP